MIKLEFLGALSFVGCSGVLVDTGKAKLVLDYGTKLQEIPPKFPLPIQGKADAVLLSHCHLDHSGAVPLFNANSNSIPVYAKDVTKNLCELLWMDSIKISREEGIELPFTKHDVVKTIDSFVPAKYRQQFNFKGSKITFFDAGHIPGSSMPLISSGGKNILYTGDFKTADSRLLKGADSDLPDIDVLITESTYGYRDHPDRKSQEKLLIETIKNTLAVNGVCLIAGFAVGRLDEILLVLDSYGIDYPLYIDGMAKKAITIINRHKSLMKEPNALDKALKKAEYITEEKQRKKIIRQPCVILTTSGMLSGGPIVGYIKKLYDNRDCSLVLSGFQCVTEDTNVYLNHEHDEIKSLFKQSDKFLKNNNLEIRKLNEKIASFNINKRCFDIGRIAFTARRRHDGEVIKLTLESGKELLLSPEHPVLTKDMKYKKAGNLTIEDEIIGV